MLSTIFETSEKTELDGRVGRESLDHDLEVAGSIYDIHSERERTYEN